MFRFISLFFVLIHLSSFASQESLEYPTLQNIRQVTFPSMGFEKAGEAYFSPDNQTIAFQAVPLGQKQYQIYVMNLAEALPKMVSTGVGACTCAFFHPSGKKMIFASSHEDPALSQNEQNVPGYKREESDYSWEFTPYMNVYEYHFDNAQLTALTTGKDYHAECAYSSDGSKIVFAGNLDGSMNLYTMNADGSDIFQVTKTNNCYNGGPFFSPDGKQIIYRADKEKRHYLQIYKIDSDGLNETQITDNQAVNWAPYWHPSGNIIAYTTSLHGHHAYEIYLKHLLTGQDHRVTHTPTFDGLPVFSNDGKQLMWTSKRGPDKTSQIFIADFILPEGW